MKVGTDSLILGAWAMPKNAKHILDVGTGTAILSLMLAQKSNSKITALEIDNSAFEQAKFNVSQSKFNDCIEVQNIDFKEYDSLKEFDFIICNPPYFDGKKLQTAREIARNETSLDLLTFVKKGATLLSKNGAIACIFPYQKLETLNSFLDTTDLFLNKVLYIKGTFNSKIKRVAVEISRNSKQLTEETLVIEEKRGLFSDDYKLLTKDYHPEKYLK